MPPADIPADNLSVPKGSLELATAPEKRLAQLTLADEMTRTVHGAEGLAIAQRASQVLFGGSMEGMKADDLIKVFANVPSRELSLDSVRDASFLDVAVVSGLCKSKGDARRLVNEGGFYINNIRITEPAGKITGDMLVDGRVLVMRAGKKNYCLVKVV